MHGTSKERKEAEEAVSEINGADAELAKKLKETAVVLEGSIWVGSIGKNSVEVELQGVFPSSYIFATTVAYRSTSMYLRAKVRGEVCSETTHVGH